MMEGGIHAVISIWALSRENEIERFIEAVALGL